jgi:hypothetical protein
VLCGATGGAVFHLAFFKEMRLFIKGRNKALGMFLKKDKPMQ